jgi:hypothetical protein
MLIIGIIIFCAVAITVLVLIIEKRGDPGDLERQYKTRKKVKRALNDNAKPGP